MVGSRQQGVGINGTTISPSFPSVRSVAVTPPDNMEPMACERPQAQQRHKGGRVVKYNGRRYAGNRVKAKKVGRGK